MIPKVVGYASF